MKIGWLLNNLIWVYFAVFAVAVYFNWQFRKRLRQNHPDTWKGLGAPSLFNNSVQNGFQSLRFMVGKKYEPLGDTTLTYYGHRARFGFFTILAFIFAFLVLILIVQAQNGVWQKPSVTTHPLNSTGGFLLLLVGVNAVIYILFVGKLKAQYPQVWNDLGQPTLLNQKISNQWKFWTFLFSDRCEKLSDNSVTIYAWALRLLTLVFGGTLLLIWFGVLHT